MTTKTKTYKMKMKTESIIQKCCQLHLQMLNTTPFYQPDLCTKPLPLQNSTLGMMMVINQAKTPKSPINLLVSPTLPSLTLNNPLSSQRIPP